jgi:hypothetical protein
VIDPNEAVSEPDDSSGGKPERSSEDVVLIHGVSDDGSALKVLRARNGSLESGAVKPLEEGKPIHGEVVRLEPREQCPLVCDVTVDVPKPEPKALPARAKKGPAQVATDAYRENWDAIWSRREKPELLN